MSQMILASASPRRKELLEQIGAEFVICPAKGEEVITETDPSAVDMELSRQKAEEVAYGVLIYNEQHADLATPQDILVIGAGDGGVVRELTRYDRVRHIDLVEMDPMVVEACRAYLPGNACRLDDRRVHLHYENALKFIRRCENKYDLIIVDSSDPFGPSEGLFTREFYGNCYKALKEDGILVYQHGSPFYDEDEDACRSMHRKVFHTFPISRVYLAHIPTCPSGYWLFGFASKKYHPLKDFKPAEWKRRNIHTEYYTTNLHTGAFMLPKYVEELLEQEEER